MGRDKYKASHPKSDTKREKSSKSGTDNQTGPIRPYPKEAHAWTLHLVVKPNSRIAHIERDLDALRIDVLSPPDKSKANTEVIKTVAEKLGVSSSQIEILFGHTNRTKVLLLHNIQLSCEEIEQRLVAT